uniref:Portal protein n=1 Tax=viral metagenome TaxID=1070528 RepID=A0A6M3XKN8_9ZZZZ
MALRPKIRAEKRQEEARALIKRKTNFEMSGGFSDLCSRWKGWDQQWRGRLARRSPPWPHASEYNPPMTFGKVEDVHAVLFGYFKNFEFFQVGSSGRRDMAADMIRQRGQDWTDLLRWSLQNESNSASHLDTFIHDGCLYGTGIGYLPWMRLVRSMRTEHYVPDEMLDPKMPNVDAIKIALGPMLLKGPKKLDEDTYKITFRDDDGQEKEGKAFVDRENPYRNEGEPVIFIERDVVYYDAPRPVNKAPYDMLVPQDVKDLQLARRFHVRDFLDINEVGELYRSGIFNMLSRNDYNLLREMAGREFPGLSAMEAGNEDAVESARDTDLGGGMLQSRTDLLPIWTEYAYEDMNGDGFAESIVRIASDTPKGPMYLACHPLEYLYPHGRRPFYDWHMVPIDGRYYGMGIPEILESSQIEANAFYQSRSDVLEIITKPGGLYNPMSGLAPGDLNYTPGMMVKARDPQRDFVPFHFPVDPSLLFREQSGIEGQAERVVGSTDMGQGRGPMRPNAPRTLGGTAIMIRQQQLRMDVYLARAMFGCGESQSGVAEFLSQYRDLYAALMPAEKEFRALGTDELRVVQRSDLQGRYDFVIDMGGDLNNPQLRTQNAMLRYQSSMNNPLIMQNPDALWKITIDMLEATGMRNAARHVPRPQGGSHPPMDQDQENQVMAKGIYIQPLPSDNHPEHLGKLAMLMQDEMRLAQMFSPAELALLGRHSQEHFQFMQAAQQAQQGQQGPMAQGNGGMSSVQGREAGAMFSPAPTAGPIESSVEPGMTP